jgi:hypothetical protein
MTRAAIIQFKATDCATAARRAANLQYVSKSHQLAKIPWGSFGHLTGSPKKGCGRPTRSRVSPKLAFPGVSDPGDSAGTGQALSPRCSHERT